MVGHSYIIYGPLLVGATTVLFEGKPVGTPDSSTFWRIVRDYGVTTLSTAPSERTPLRPPSLSFPSTGDEYHRELMILFLFPSSSRPPSHQERRPTEPPPEADWRARGPQDAKGPVPSGREVRALDRHDVPGPAPELRRARRAGDR